MNALARCVQTLPADFLEDVGAPIINIHISSLPAFIGAALHRKPTEGESNSSARWSTT